LPEIPTEKQTDSQYIFLRRTDGVQITNSQVTLSVSLILVKRKKWKSYPSQTVLCW